MSRDDRKRKADDSVADSGFVKAVVSEQNGEVSCSIEETNRIRALLGMKPLVLNSDSDEKKAVKNFKQKQEEEKRAVDEAEIRKRIEQAKTKRLLNEKITGSTLGSVENESEGDLLSAANWVQRSRQKQMSDREKADLAAQRLEEAELSASRTAYQSSELKGLQIMHGASDFEIGQDVILTLADSSILEVDDNGKMIGMNTKSDVLENVNFADNERRMERENRQKRLRQPIYAGHDDHEFSADGSARSILPQYDTEKKQGPKLVLGDEGITVGNDSTPSLVVDNVGIKSAPISLSMESKEANDFYTNVEYASFAKHKNRGDKEKKKRKIRKKLDDDEDNEGGTTGGVSGMIAMLEAELEEGKHSAGQAVNNSEAGKSELKLVVPTKKIYAPVEDDDADLQRAVAYSRKFALLQASRDVPQEITDDAGASIARSLLEKTTKVMSEAHSESKMELDESTGAGFYGTKKYVHADSNRDVEAELKFDEIDSEGRRADGSLIFTSTTEFTTRLQARLNEKARSRAEAAVRAAAASEQTEITREDETEQANESTMQVDSEDVNEDSDSNVNDDDEQLNFVHRQPLVASGMAATLALLKGSGELHQKEQLAGRAKDSRDVDPSAKDYAVKLEYRDEHGRLLTQKEAFRQMCYRFHGIAPSKKKAEKRLAALENSSKAASGRGVLETGTMKSLLKTQEATGKAHVTVQGGLAGLTSAVDLAANISKNKSKNKK